MTGLNDTTMLVKLGAACWQGRKLDRTATQEVADAHNVAPRMGAYRKAVIDPVALKPCKKIIGEARHWHLDNTLPWFDGGWRILMNKTFMGYSQKGQEFTNAFDGAADDFARIYPALISEAKTTWGSLFNPRDYPDPAEIRDLFVLEFETLPVPNDQDFRVPDNKEMERRLSNQYRQAEEMRTQAAMREVWDRVANTVTHMRDRLNDYEVKDGKVKAPFRDSLIGNVREIVTIMGNLNITGDENLNRMQQELAASLCPLDPDALRKDPAARAVAAGKADDILKKMADYMPAK